MVAAGKKFKTIGVVRHVQLRHVELRPDNPPQPQLTSLSVEQRVTSALLFVTAARNVTLYVLQGHGEQTLDSLGLTTAVSNENYAVKDAQPPHGEGRAGGRRHPADPGAEDGPHARRTRTSCARSSAAAAGR